MLGSSARLASGKTLGQICVFHTQRRPRHECNQDSDPSLALLEVVLQERDEAQLSSPYQAPPSWKSTCLLCQFQHERDRATPLPRWSFPEAAASVAFAIVTDNDVGTPTVRRSEDWRGPTITQ